MTAEVKTGAEFDICIIGAGPAGIICCFELCRLRPDLKIALIEYGEAPAGTNSLDSTIENVNTLNHHPPDECTNKGFGGTSATWGGRCVTYEEIDFLPREIIGNECTWDVDVFEDVKKFYEVTAEYMDCGAARFFYGECFPNRTDHISEKFKPGEIRDDCLERWSPPRRFTSADKAKLDDYKNFTYIDQVEVVELVPNVSGGVRIKGKVAGAAEVSEFFAKKVVVAAGAQESTRLLLLSKGLFPEGLPESLGLYYQGHISGKIASIVFEGDPKKTDYGFQIDDGIYVRRRFQFSRDLLLKENLLNTALWLDNGIYSDPSHRNGTMSFIYLMMVMPVIGKKLAPPAIAHSLTKGKKPSMSAHLRNILLGMPKSLIEPASIFVGRYFPKRKLPGVFLYNASNRYALHFHAEQVPIKENRMTLGPDGHTLKIEYSYCDADVESVIRTHQVLDDYLRKTGAGRLEYWCPPEQFAAKIRAESKDGIHQNGTTRMSRKREDGVVDCDMRLWSNDDVYVCSSSAFPTSGQANPTFVLGAFAARLADHLAK